MEKRRPAELRRSAGFLFFPAFRKYREQKYLNRKNVEHDRKWKDQC